MVDLQQQCQLFSLAVRCISVSVYQCGEKCARGMALMGYHTDGHCCASSSYKLSPRSKENLALGYILKSWFVGFSAFC